MKIPRISIHALMAAVLVIALDCMVAKAVIARDYRTSDLMVLLLATLPMAHILAVGAAILARGPVRARPFLLGFELGGWIAVLVAMFMYDPILDRVDQALLPGRLWTWIMALSGSMQVLVEIALVVGTFLILDLIVALICGWIARKFVRAISTEERSPRPRFVPPMVALLLLTVPSLAVMGYLRWVIDPQEQRRPAGFEAVVDLSRGMAAPAPPPMAINLATLVGAKVKVDRDVAPCLAKAFGIADGTGNTTLHTNDYRPVKVTILDGDRASQTMEIPHCYLRPVTQPPSEFAIPLPPGMPSPMSPPPISSQ